MHEARMSSRTASAALVIALLAWGVLVLGLVYARFVVSEPPPDVVITFSDKGLTRLFVELVSLGLGLLGLVLVMVGVVRAVRGRALALAAVANASVCTVCVALLI